jgi:hypothetical protein
MHHNSGVPHPTSPRRVLHAICAVFVVGLVATVSLACSQSTSHPPTSGDCVGDLCPPGTPRTVTPGNPGDGAAPDAGGADADVPETAPNDSGNLSDAPND